jgi:hypothetical protein
VQDLDGLSRNPERLGAARRHQSTQILIELQTLRDQTEDARPLAAIFQQHEASQTGLFQRLEQGFISQGDEAGRIDLQPQGEPGPVQERVAVVLLEMEKAVTARIAGDKARRDAVTAMGNPGFALRRELESAEVSALGIGFQFQMKQGAGADQRQQGSKRPVPDLFGVQPLQSAAQFAQFGRQGVGQGLKIRRIGKQHRDPDPAQGVSPVGAMRQFLGGAPLQTLGEHRGQA